MKASLEIKSVTRGKNGDTVKLIEDPIDRLPPTIELRGGATDGQVASAKAMRFDREAGRLTLVCATTGEVVLEMDGDLVLSDSWAPDEDSEIPKGSCKWSFDTGKISGAKIGKLFESGSLQAAWKPAQRTMKFKPGRETAA